MANSNNKPIKKTSFKDSSHREKEITHPIQYPVPWDQIASDPTAWNHFISGLGLKMQHWAYIPYILGANQTGTLRNYDDTNKVLDERPYLLYDNNGIYKYMGDVYVIWQSNSKQLNQMPAGYYPDSSAVITVNRQYIHTNKIVGLSVFDRLVPILDSNTNPLEFASVNWEQIAHNPGGIDKLMFPAVDIEFLIDANGIEYIKGQDFELAKGHIRWLPSGRRPGINNLTGEGVIYAIRYYYIPAFYVKYAAHDIRSHSTIHPTLGTKQAIRGPITAMIQIDWVFLQSLKSQERHNNSAPYFGSGGNLGPA